MSKILIENYRGFDIEFDTNYEKFQCICTEESAKESTVFTAVKKFIDDYKKTNQDFNSFWVEPVPDTYNKQALKIIGVRKDGRFVAENLKGEKHQIPDYSLSDYMLLIPENEVAIKALEILENEEGKRKKEYQLKKVSIINGLKVVTLKNFKNTM